MALERFAIRASLVLVGLTAAGVLANIVVLMSEGAYLYIRPWGTVLASILLLTAAYGGLRGRTWGVFLAGLAGTAFAGAWAVGIAPWWFVAVAAVAFLPTVAASRRLFGFDTAAAAIGVAVVLALGGAAALFAGPGLDALLGW